MLVGHMTPNIIRFTYHQEKGDPGYGSCVWAHFDFDVDNYDLSIHSDCGSYGYGWCITPSEPFLELMSRIGDDYLLRKMCKESLCDWEATKESIIETLRERDDLDEDDVESAIESLEVLDDDYDLESSPGATSVLVENWNEENCRIEDIWEYVKTTYTGDEKKIVQVFADYIQPAIREYLKEAGT